MGDGIAIPHARSEAVERVCFAIGLKQGGIEFGSLDGERTQIFILIASPKTGSGPHLQLLAALGGLLKDESLRSDLLSARSPDNLVEILRRGGPNAATAHSASNLPDAGPETEDE